MTSRETESKTPDTIFTAKTANGDMIFIAQAQSGKNGYFCQGCGQELVAKIGVRQLKIPHFAHVARSVEQKRLCQYADETYRHGVAKAILQQTKQVAVPEVLVYPPNAQPGDPRRLRQGQIIQAAHVAIENTLRLWPDGQLRIGKFEKIEMDASGDVYIIPDIIFLDQQKRPILLIELVATHRPDTKKLAALSLLGIDTIQIDLPEHSVEAIKHSFRTTQFTKWLYNKEQAQAIYADIPPVIGRGIPPIDAVQEQLLQENVRCRTSRIRNLIRGVNGYLESESNRQVTATINAAIQRVIAEEVHVDGLLNRQDEEIKQTIRDRFSKEVAQFEREKGEVDAMEDRLGNEEADIEAKYLSETQRLDDEQAAVRERSTPRVKQLEEDIAATRRAISECNRKNDDTDSAFRDAFNRTVSEDRSRISRNQEELRASQRAHEAAASDNQRLERTYNGAVAEEEKLNGRITADKRTIDTVTRPRIAALTAEVSQLEAAPAENPASRAGRIQQRVDAVERAANARISNRDPARLPDELRGFEQLLTEWESGHNYRRNEAINRRLREAIRALESATWKTWYKPENV